MQQTETLCANYICPRKQRCSLHQSLVETVTAVKVLPGSAVALVMWTYEAEDCEHFKEIGDA